MDHSGFRLEQTNFRRSNVAGDFDFVAASFSWAPLTRILFLNYVAAASSRAFRDEAGTLVLSLVLLLNL